MAAYHGHLDKTEDLRVEGSELRRLTSSADVRRSVQGNLFTCSSATLGWDTTTQIPCKRNFRTSHFFHAPEEAVSRSALHGAASTRTEAHPVFTGVRPNQ